MVAGHLRIKDGNYHIVLSYNDENGKRKSTCRSTHLPVRGNKKRAEAMLQEARREMEETLRCQELAKRQGKSPERKPIFFTDFMNEWLSMMKPSLEATTYSSYQNGIQKQIIPYFEKRYPKLLLQDLTARHIQEYYSYELEERKCSTNTVIHRHANIRKALQYAFKTDLIDCNPADKIQRPRKNRHEVVPYNAQELAQLFEAVKGNLLELGVQLAAFYG
ncbi:MAG: tyrosine-type recombinase/integrase family protein, partial [Oscillospiraceae bacterium]|nr:tyrosine-type recombinase/integrase family protein [Oscillospiraceae bacterium]